MDIIAAYDDFSSPPLQRYWEEARIPPARPVCSTSYPQFFGNNVVYSRWLWYCLCGYHLVSGLLCWLCSPLCYADSIKRLYLQCDQWSSFPHIGIPGFGFASSSYANRSSKCYHWPYWLAAISLLRYFLVVLIMHMYVCVCILKLVLLFLCPAAARKC